MSKGKESKINLVTILIIPIAVAINWVGGTLAGLLKLPIYLDSIGTFLVSILAGPIVGCITGILSNVVVSLTAPTALPYAIVSAIFGITTGLLAKKGMFKLREEGYTDGKWIVLDYGDFIVHIFNREEREYYGIERLWKNENNFTHYNKE